MKGKLVHGCGAFTIDCAIHDISAGGAKVVLAKQQALPWELYLIVAKYGMAYDARVVWQKFPARGLMFREAYLLAATLPESAKFLRRLWVDLCARPGAAT